MLWESSQEGWCSSPGGMTKSMKGGLGNFLWEAGRGGLVQWMG